MGLVHGADPGSRNSAKDDAAQLQGTWAIVSVDIDGRHLAMDAIKSATLSVRGTQYSFRLDQTAWELTFKVDPSKTPKAIDLRVVKGPEQGKVYHGIYKIDNDLYTICRTTVPGKERPHEFATRAESGLMIVVWRHVVRPPASVLQRP